MSVRGCLCLVILALYTAVMLGPYIYVYYL